MAITHTEQRKQGTTIDRSRPQATREWTIWGSLVKTDIQLYIVANVPTTDTGVDFETGAAITLFINNVDLHEIGGGVWSAVIRYESTPTTTDLTFTFGVQTVKIQQAIRSIRTYNCQNPVSAATVTIALAAEAAAFAIQALADALLPLTVAASDAADAATAAAGVAGVDVTVAAAVLNCATKVGTAVAFGDDLYTVSLEVVEPTQEAAYAAMQADISESDAQADLAEAVAVDAQADYDGLDPDVTDAINYAADAQTAAMGQNAQSIAAADAATDAAVAANSMRTAADTLNDAVQAAAVAARAAADAAAGETDIGVSVPNMHLVIGQNGDKIEGVDIERGAVEFSVTKKFQRTLLSATYLQTINEMQANPLGTPTNDDTFILVWMGQTITFPRCSLRFRTSSIRSTSGADLEMSFHFAYSRGILLSDDYHIGNSVAITQRGWEYGWTRYVPSTSNGAVTNEPASHHVDQVYPEDDFGKLNL